MVILKLKNVQTGKVIEDRVRAGSDIEIVRVDKRPMQYLYRDGDSYHFMDSETFEQIQIPGDTIGDPASTSKKAIADCCSMTTTEFWGLSANVRHLKMTEASTALRGDTATNVNKLVTLETGAIVQVPAFVTEGDTIRVDTRTGEYIERVK